MSPDGPGLPGACGSNVNSRGAGPVAVHCDGDGQGDGNRGRPRSWSPGRFWQGQESPGAVGSNVTLPEPTFADLRCTARRKGTSRRTASSPGSAMPQNRRRVLEPHPGTASPAHAGRRSTSRPSPENGPCTARQTGHADSREPRRNALDRRRARGAGTAVGSNVTSPPPEDDRGCNCATERARQGTAGRRRSRSRLRGRKSQVGSNVATRPLEVGDRALRTRTGQATAARSPPIVAVVTVAGPPED